MESESDLIDHVCPCRREEREGPQTTEHTSETWPLPFPPLRVPTHLPWWTSSLPAILSGASPSGFTGPVYSRPHFAPLTVTLKASSRPFLGVLCCFFWGPLPQAEDTSLLFLSHLVINSRQTYSCLLGVIHHPVPSALNKGASWEGPGS